MTGLERRIELGWTHYAMVFEALVALGLLRVCVAFGLQSIAGFAFREVEAEAAVPHPHLQRRISETVARASRYLPGDTKCLSRALAGKWMLWRRGWPATVRLGVGRRADGSLHAHAWLVVGGRVIIGGDEMAGITPLAAVEVMR